jgi:hypothetical protein
LIGLRAGGESFCFERGAFCAKPRLQKTWFIREFEIRFSNTAKEQSNGVPAICPNRSNGVNDCDEVHQLISVYGFCGRIQTFGLNYGTSVAVHVFTSISNDDQDSHAMKSDNRSHVTIDRTIQAIAGSCICSGSQH